MICKNCGTEIADKAIICYRCGTATTDPVRKPAEIRTRRGGLFSLVVMVLLVLLGLFLGQAGRTMTDSRGSWLEMMAGICLVAALALLLARVLRRR
jgi:protein-S-isoprenylcysteine O-methyltransferase Ste14